MGEVIGAVIGVVGDDQCAAAQARLDQRRDVRVQRLGAVEQQQVDALGQVGGQRLQCIALADAAPLYRDAPEARAAREAGDRAFEAFMQQVLPGVPVPARALAGELITRTLSAVGADFSASPRSEAEIHAQADAMADMFAAYLRSLGAT